MRKWFDRLDGDKDGKLTDAELRQHARRMRQSAPVEQGRRRAGGGPRAPAEGRDAQQHHPLTGRPSPRGASSAAQSG